VRFKVGNRQQIIDRLKAAQDDFYVFSHPPQLEGLAQLEFLPNPLVAIAHKNHRLARAEKLDITSLLNEPFLMREFGSGTRHAIENFMKKLSLPLAPKMTIESNEAIKHAVMANLGISILSTHTLDFAQDNDLAILDVTQLPISSRWYFLWLEQKTVSPIAKTFLDYVTDEGRHHLLKKLSTC
jgi:DNA-binding transcriptional LysR family regulator